VPNVFQCVSHVQIRMGASPLVEQAIKPLVVLDAAVFCFDELGQEDSPTCWQTLPGFGEGCIPGFSKSGRAVMLIQSAQLSVASVQDLQQVGLTCSSLPKVQLAQETLEVPPPPFD
jgi:hypothetical protein